MKYVTGLVVGKFCPMHKGHELVIATALQQCEKVIVLSYTSYEDVVHKHFSSETRLKWLQSLPDQYRLDIHVLDPVEDMYPDDSDSDEAHRFFCSSYLLNELETTVQAVFGSDDYLTGFAEYLSKYFNSKLKLTYDVCPVYVDSTRSTFPMSGTYLRNLDLKNPEQAKIFQESVSPTVSATFLKRICLLGAESTGKTTLAKMLEKHFDTQAVYEYGRILYKQRNGELVYEDMLRIAQNQLEDESRASHTIACYDSMATPLIADTSPLTTVFYSQELFGRVSDKLQRLASNLDDYDRIYLSAPDFPMVQDGTRQDETFRQKGHEFYLKELGYNYPEYVLLEGTLEEKFETILKDLESLL